MVALLLLLLFNKRFFFYCLMRFLLLLLFVLILFEDVPGLSSPIVLVKFFKLLFKLVLFLLLFTATFVIDPVIPFIFESSISSAWLPNPPLVVAIFIIVFVLLLVPLRGLKEVFLTSEGCCKFEDDGGGYLAFWLVICGDCWLMISLFWLSSTRLLLPDVTYMLCYESVMILVEDRFVCLILNMDFMKFLL